MLRFLSSLFSGDTRDEGAVSPQIVSTAIERAVNGTDPRLRFFRNYQKQLRDPVEHAVKHLIELVDNLPPSSELSTNTFRADPRIRAFFVSPDHICETISGFKTVTDYLAQKSGAIPNEIFGLLTMEREERNTLGMQLEGDHVRRDVSQVSVNFFHSRYLAPSDSETTTRQELKIRAFDFLVETSLERIASSRSRKAELEKQRLLLRKKHDAMKAGHWGLASMLENNETRNADIPNLETEINKLDEALEQQGADTGDMQRSFDVLIDTFNRSEDWLGIQTITLHIDNMGKKVDAASASSSNKLELSELYSETGERRIAMLARFPRAELPEKPDFFQQASRYFT